MLLELAILTEIFIQIGYFFLRVMQENKSGCFFLNTVYIYTVVMLFKSC